MYTHMTRMHIPYIYIRINFVYTHTKFIRVYIYIYCIYIRVCIYSTYSIVVLYRIRDQTRGEQLIAHANKPKRNPASPQHKNWAATSHNPTVLLAIAQGQKSLENGGSGQPICP